MASSPVSPSKELNLEKLLGVALPYFHHQLCEKNSKKSNNHEEIKLLVWTSMLRLWQNGLWSFQTGDTKLERFLPKNQHIYQKEIIEF